MTRTIFARGNKGLSTAAALALLLVLGSGCNVFYDAQEVNGVTEITFDSTLPNSPENVIAVCADPIVISGSTTEIDLTADCEGSDFSDPADQTLYAGLNVAGVVDLGDSLFPEELALQLNDTYVVDGFPWPVQNCEAVIELKYPCSLKIRLMGRFG